MIEERILKWLRRYGINASYDCHTNSIWYKTSRPASQNFVKELNEEFEFDIKSIRYDYLKCTQIIRLN